MSDADITDLAEVLAYFIVDQDYDEVSDPEVLVLLLEAKLKEQLQ